MKMWVEIGYLSAASFQINDSLLLDFESVGIDHEGEDWKVILLLRKDSEQRRCTTLWISIKRLIFQRKAVTLSRSQLNRTVRFAILIPGGLIWPVERCQSDECRRGLSSSPRDDHTFREGIFHITLSYYSLYYSSQILTPKADPERFATEIRLYWRYQCCQIPPTEWVISWDWYRC